MKLVGLDCFGYELRYAHGEYVMSGGRAAASQTGTLVRLRTDEGMDGWGEITPLGSTYLPTFAEGVRTALRFLAPHLLGLDPTNDQMIDERYIVVGWGRDYADVPPLRGIIYTDAESSVIVSKSMTCCASPSDITPNATMPVAPSRAAPVRSGDRPGILPIMTST